MKTVSQIITLHGGLDALDKPIRVENPPFMRLVIERLGVGPRGIEISVAHYREEDGDLCRDPEMVFSVDPLGQLPWGPIEFTQDIPGMTTLYMRAVWAGADGQVYVNKEIAKYLIQFAKSWDARLSQRGYFEAAANQVIREAMDCLAIKNVAK